MEKTIFEYWTHALSYVPTADFRFFLLRMRDRKKGPSSWFSDTSEKDYRHVLSLIKKNGPLSIQAFDSDVLEEKTFAWGSRKPSKKALQKAFYRGKLTVSERLGMLIKYDLIDRHFGWDQNPTAATENEFHEYLLDRALRAQAVVSIDSICHLDAPRKKSLRALIETKVLKKELISVKIQNVEKIDHWVSPKYLGQKLEANLDCVHILSPFDPLIIQRKRSKAIFDYFHLFEAYVPKEKRVFGYFTLPVLAGEEIIALLDLKTDRQQGKLLIQSWNWLAGHKSRENIVKIEAALAVFEMFQLNY